MHGETRISNYVLACLSGLSLTLLALPTEAPVQSLRAALIYVMRPSFYYGSEGAQRLSEVPQRMRHLLEADIENSELRQKLPHADPAAIDKLAKDPKVENVEDLFTVNMVVNFLASKLG